MLPRSGRRRRLWLVIGAAVLAVVVVAAGVVVGRFLGPRSDAPSRAASPTANSTAVTSAAPASPSIGAPPTPRDAPDPSALAADFAALETRLQAQAGIVISAVGAGRTQITLGDWQHGPAWSTIKVPLSIAVLRDANPPAVTDAMVAAITESDTAAAESMWATLGDPATAARKVDDVLRQAGDPTAVQSQNVRPPYSAFGQTDWSLADQVRFTSAAFCDDANAPVFDLMGRVTTDQRWGIGTIADSRFKGGWGPSPAGNYLVRQLGVVAGPNGMIAVAMAAAPDSGQFADGTADLTEMARWLVAHLGALPAGNCG